jgi:ribose-phosphate pyrophosphokinase
MIVKFHSKDEVFDVTPVFSIYPDGQPHVKVDGANYNECRFAEIQCSIRNPKELFDFVMLWDTLERNVPVKGLVYWLFGIRMDRPIDNLQPSTFETVKSVLGKRIGRIELFDPHNYNVCKDFGQIIEPESSINFSIYFFSNYCHEACDIFLPDAGAEKRYRKMIDPKLNILIGAKKRNSQTGYLSDFSIEFGERKSNNVLIIDDICAGGFTFSEQQKVLEREGYTKFGLYTILGKFSRIYSTNSFQFGNSILGVKNDFHNLNTFSIKDESLFLESQQRITF